VIGLALFEQFSPRNPVLIPTGGAVPPVYTWLRAQPPGALLEFPFMSNSAGGYLIANYYQYFSIYHQRPILNGNFTGVMPSGIAALTPQLRDDFPSPELLDQLRGLDIRYLVVHYDNLSYKQQVRFASASIASQLEQLATFDAAGEPRFNAGRDTPGSSVTEAAPIAPRRGDTVYAIKDTPSSMFSLPKMVPAGSKVYISTARHKSQDTYMAVVGTMLARQGSDVYGYNKLFFGQTIKRDDPMVKYDYLVLYGDEDPTKYRRKVELLW
jgi:hypothetical protein